VARVSVGSVVVGNQRCASGLKDGLDSGGVADNAETIPKAGGIEAVIGGMKAHEESADVQKKGCSVLHTLGWGGARFTETRVAIVAAGGIEAVVGAMKAHEGSAEVQARCCRVLWTIDDKAATAIVAAGGIEAVVGAMKAHEGNADVQEEGSTALRGLTDKNEAAIVAAGGIEAVVGAMKALEGNVRVQTEGCRVLRMLAPDGGCMGVVGAGGRQKMGCWNVWSCASPHRLLVGQPFVPCAPILSIIHALHLVL